MEIIVMGAGGHAREIRDIAEEPGQAPSVSVTAFYTEPGFGPSPADLELLRVDAREGVPASGQGGFYVAAVGDPQVRARLAGLAEAAGLVPLTIVSVHARVVPQIPADHGAVVFPMAYVSSNSIVGRHVHINAGATVSHDAVLEDFATLGPGCRVTGGAHIGAYAVLGAGCVVLPGRHIGAGATVGAGAVVIDDVPDGIVVVGIPARRISSRQH